MLQDLLVGLIVSACAAYVGWALLLPLTLRRRLAQALLRRRWPAGVQERLQAAAQVRSGCGCEGCDASPARSETVAVQTVHWAPRRRR
jgi:hypothetical protein